MEQPFWKRLLALEGWTKVALFLLIGTMFVGKAAPYIAIGLGGLLLLSPRVLWDRWFHALTRGTDYLNGIAWPLLISLIYGFAQLIYGLLLGYSLKTAALILVFNICPVYLFLGIWVGFRHPEMVRKYIRFIAWYTLIYTPVYFLFLRKLSIAGAGGDPDSYPIFGNPGSGSTTILGLLAYEPSLVRFWAPILVLTGLTIANQERADWLGLGLALTLWGKLAKKMGRVFGVLGVLTAILLIAALIDLRLPPIPGRGGELSARGTLARMAGSISPEFAQAMEENRTDANFYYGTVLWRKHWWAMIRQEVTRDPQTLIFGLGYGYPLARLTGNEGTIKEGTRSPHNIFYFTLAYSGIIGVVIFFWFELLLLRLLYRVYQITGQIYGLAYFIYCFVGAFFGNFLETPSAITFYLVLGLCIGPMFLQLELEKHPQYHELAEPDHVAEMA
jgi:hypothetical protein